MYMNYLFFIDIGKCVKINGLLLESFKIERGILQDFFLVPYSFLSIAKAFNAMIIKEIEFGAISSIQLQIAN